MGIFGPNIDKLSSENNINGLIKLLKHRKPQIRLKAFFALSRNRDEAVLSQMKELVHDRDPKVRTIATLKFGELGDESVLDNYRTIILSGTQKEKIDALITTTGTRGMNILYRLSSISDN